MSRAKLSEFRAKKIIGVALGQPYDGIAINLKELDHSKIREYCERLGGTFVVKVDQGVKRRNKLGLVKLNIRADDVSATIDELAEAGYQWLLLEPFMAHEPDSERFVAFTRESDGVHLSYSQKGGVDIEENAASLQRTVISEGRIDASFGDARDQAMLHRLYECFEDNYFSYLEINPYIAGGEHPVALDAAVEVDTAAAFFVSSWSNEDLRDPRNASSSQEKIVEQLAAKSPSSLSLKVLNPNGTVFVLLSGGGASVVIADEFANHGLHDQLANYGEYSGNPTEDETYLYTKQVLSLLIASTAENKVLLIAGGVANFTDVSRTFGGIIRALKDDIQALKAQHVAVLVRRGGPNAAAGLEKMRAFLNDNDIPNEVCGAEVSLAEIVNKAAGRLR